MTRSRLGKQLAEVVSVLNRMGVPFALIGGLALAVHQVIRATQDVDFLVASENAEEIDKALTELGYRCVHRSADAGNYLRVDERIDLLYASRPIARRLLAAAVEQKTALGEFRVIGVEGLIAFKLQGWINDPHRTQDLEDIRALLRVHRTTLKTAEVREYFRLFDQEPLFDELQHSID